jgi:hypothetical protein
MSADADNAVTPEPSAAKPPASPLVTPEPAAFRHTWARTALREGLIFLLISAAIVVVSGIFLPISNDAYWLLLKIVVGIGAGMGLLFYLVGVVPRLLIAWVVRTHAGLPELYRRKREEEAFGQVFWISWVLIASICVLIGIWSGGFFVCLVGGIVGGGLISCFIGVLNNGRLQAWHFVVRFLLRRYSLTPPIEAPADGYADTLMKPPETDNEPDPPFADTDIISSRRPETRTAASTNIRAEEGGQ